MYGVVTCIVRDEECSLNTRYGVCIRSERWVKHDSKTSGAVRGRDVNSTIMFCLFPVGVCYLGLVLQTWNLSVDFYAYLCGRQI